MILISDRDTAVQVNAGNKCVAWWEKNREKIEKNGKKDKKGFHHGACPQFAAKMRSITLIKVIG